MKKQLLFLLVLFFLLSGINMTYATTYTWHGGASGSWGVTTNWLPNGTPTNADDVVFGNSAAVTVGTGVIPDVNNLTINSGFTVSITQTTASDLFTVEGTLAVSTSSSLTFSNAQNVNIILFTIDGSLIFDLSSYGFLGQGTSSATSTTTVKNGSQLTVQLSFVNGGIFNLDGTASPSTLFLTKSTPYKASFTNSGTFNQISGATNAATIQIVNSGDSFTNSGTMTITGAASVVNVTNTVDKFTNNGTLTATGTAFVFQGVAGGSTKGSWLENIGSGVFNSTNCTFGFYNVNAALVNDFGATFNDSGSTFTFNSAEGSASNFTFYNGGKFYALNGTQINITSGPAGLYNGGTTLYTTGENSADTAFFILGSTSKINASGNNVGIYNNYPNANPSTTATGVFIINSDANNSGYIFANATSFHSGFTATFDGQYYVQRYITGNNDPNYRGYRLISSPVNNTSATPGSSNYIDFSTLNKTFHTANPLLTYHGIFTAGQGAWFNLYNQNSSLYLYNETLNPSLPIKTFNGGKYPLITNVSSGTVDWSSTSTGSLVTGSGTQVPVGNGMLIYYIGPNTRTDVSSATAPGNSTISYLGYLNQGNITVYPWFTPGTAHLSTSAIPAGNYPGVNLVGNPYAAMIDLTQVAADNSGLTTFYELTDGANTQNNYILYPITYAAGNITTASIYTSRYVESGQGFFVTATASQALVFKEDQKVYNTSVLTSGSTPAGVLVTNTDKKSLINSASSKAISQSSGSDFAGLHLMLSKDSTNFHEAGIYFGKIYSDKLDKYDAPDLSGSSVKTLLSSLTADGSKVAINGMETYTNGKSVKLFVQGAIDGTYSLKLSDVINIDPTIATINLIDNYKNVTTTLSAGKSYSFDIINADTNSFGSNRFVLSVQRRALPPYQLLAFTAAKVKSNIAVNWQTANEGNYTGFGVQKLDLASNKFLTIDTLQSNGNGNYLFNDPSAVTGNNTYRLAQNNINGVVSYSAPVTVKYGLLSLPKSLSIFPNPVKDNAVFDFSGIATNENTTYEVNVYNSLGVLILQKTATTNFLSSDMSSLRAGIYVVQVKSNNGSVLAKSTFIKN